MNKTLQIGILRLTAFYLRHTPLEYGRWRITNTMLTQLRDVGANMGEIVVSTRWNFRFICRMDDWLSQYIYLTGSYERPTTDVMAKLMRPGDIALDVGANVGYFSLLLATLAQESGHVYSFEPIPDVARDMKRNITLNGLDNITLIQSVVCNENAMQTIYEGPSDHRGISSLRRIENACEELTVQGIRLDDQQLELPHLRLIKIDVEGAEQLALEGMSKLVERHRPYIVLEFTDKFLRNFGHSVQTLINWFHERDYNLYRITDNGLHSLRHEDDTLPSQYNVLCSPTPEPPSGLSYFSQ